jgi:hypothetical protein
MAYTKYSLTPANNNAAPPDGAPEGMLPSAVNDTMRDMMAQIRDVGDGIRGGTYTMTAPVITGGSITGVALSGNTLTNPVITGGSINNTPIGASTANTGAFTTLSASSTVSGTGFSTYLASPPAIGGTAAAAGNFTTLGATGVATFSAGTVSAPAITTTGDTNTGIFFPAADTIAFTEGGVESMRIDSSGILNLTNNPILSAGTVNGVVYLNGSKSATSSSSFTFNGTRLTTYITNTGNTNVARFGVVNAGVTDDAFLDIFADLTNNLVTLDSTGNNAGALAFKNGGSESMRITSAGNVGIGLTSPNSKLQIYAGTGIGASHAIMGSAGITGYWDYSNGGASSTRVIARGYDSSAVEQIRLDPQSSSFLLGGNVGIGTNSPTTLLTVGDGAAATRRTLTLNGGANAGIGALIDLQLGGTSSGYLATSNWAASDTSSDVILYANTARGIRFYTNGTNERMRIDSSGNLLVGITSARANAGDVQVSKGISFPATQSAQSDANTLDDYEEGTWTPVISGSTTAGTGTYTAQVGTYTKIGNFVTVAAYVHITAHTGSGNFLFSGLPFTSELRTNSYHSAALGYVSNISLTASNYLQAYIGPNSLNIAIGQTPVGGGTFSAITLDTAFELMVSATYRV